MPNDFPSFVWHMGRVWFNPHHSPDSLGRIHLYALNIAANGEGKGVLPSQIYPCDAETVKAIKDAQEAGQLQSFD